MARPWDEILVLLCGHAQVVTLGEPYTLHIVRNGENGQNVSDKTGAQYVEP